MPNFLMAVFCGIISTITMDLGSVILTQVRMTDYVQFRMIGRYANGFLRGRLLYDNPMSVEATRFEFAKGIVGHYLIGVFLASLFIFIIAQIKLNAHLLIQAIGYGVISLAIPWVLLSPALGLGLAAKKVPEPNRSKMLRANVVNHVLYGIGLYVGVSLYQYFLNMPSFV